ncbi:MAG: tetratricopeptide repeat protein [Planctomyces sp.]|nr:tetratricopeptide repeat protein [Planctomyces sp.]
MPTAHELYDEAIRIKDQGDLPGAVEKLRQVLDVDPAHTDTHAALAVYLQRLGQHDDAISHSKKVVELMPDDVFAYTQLSVIYMRCGRIMEAEEAKAQAHLRSGHGHAH